MATSTVETAGGTNRHPKRRTEPRRARAARPLEALDLIEDLVQFVVAGVLILVAAVVLYHYVADFFRLNMPFSTRITNVTNGVLFVIIILELLTTVMSHFDYGGFQLKPFLIIGIISAVRHILTVGAQESLGGKEKSDIFQQAQVSLGVNAGLVLALVIGLILVRRTDVDDNAAVDVD